MKLRKKTPFDKSLDALSLSKEVKQVLRELKDELDACYKEQLKALRKRVRELEDELEHYY